MTTPEDASSPEAPAPFRPPTWPRALGILVLVVMLAASVFSAWIMVLYWNQISV